MDNLTQKMILNRNKKRAITAAMRQAGNPSSVDRLRIQKMPFSKEPNE